MSKVTEVNSRCFQLHCSYSNSFNLSNVGNFFRKSNSKGMYLSSQKKKKKETPCLAFSSSIKCEIKKVSCCSRAVMAKKCTK